MPWLSWFMLTCFRSNCKHQVQRKKSSAFFDLCFYTAQHENEAVAAKRVQSIHLCSGFQNSDSGNSAASTCDSIQKNTYHLEAPIWSETLDTVSMWFSIQETTPYKQLSLLPPQGKQQKVLANKCTKLQHQQNIAFLIWQKPLLILTGTRSLFRDFPFFSTSFTRALFEAPLEYWGTIPIRLGNAKCRHRKMATASRVSS